MSAGLALPRLAFVSTSTTLGGAEKTLHLLASRVDRRKFQVAGVISLKPAGAYARKIGELGIPVTSLDMGGCPSWTTWRRLLQALDELKPDIVHAIMFQAMQLSRLAKLSGRSFALLGSPRVAPRSRSRLTLLLDGMLKGADDLLVAESEATRRYMIDRLRYQEARVRTIYNGVEPESADPAFRQRLRGELGLSSGELLIGSAGRLDAQKAHWVLIDAIARMPRLAGRCIIIGQGPEQLNLEARIKALGLQGRVILAGEKSDLSPWLSAMDVFVLPSLWEGLPNALLEAMALGLPCVASAVDGVPELIEDGKSGMLAPAGDATALAARISELASGLELRQRLGEAAKARTSAFSVERMIRAYEDAYESLGAGARSAA